MLIRRIIGSHLCAAIGGQQFCKESRKLQTKISFEDHYSIFRYRLLSCCYVATLLRSKVVFTMKQIFEKSWEYGKNLFVCFVDLEKAYDRAPRDKLGKGLWEYGIDGQLLYAIKSFYCQPEVCVLVNRKQSKPFHVGFGIRQGCVLSPLLFIVYVNWIDKCRQADECATTRNCKIVVCFSLIIWLLLSFTKCGLQRVLNRFADASDTVGTKISTAKTEVLHLSRNPDQC